jgi:hypothetical protein
MSDFMQHIQHTYDEAQPVTKHLNVYEVGREYGGPEEGGWWYDTGRFDADKSEVFTGTGDALYERAGELQHSLDAQANNYATPAVHSVLYRGGRYRIRVEDTPGQDYPTERPYYS